MMRLTSKDWEILEKVPTAWWESWLEESFGYRCANLGESRRKFELYGRDTGAEPYIELPVDRSLVDYRLRLSEMLDAVAHENPDRSIMCELIVLFVSSIDPEVYREDPRTSGELATILLERLGACKR